MNLTRNIVALQKGMVCPPNNGEDNRNLVSVVQSHLMQWGYILDEKSFEMLSKANKEFIVNFNDEVLGHLKEVLGGNRNYTPFYKNFPKEVMEKSDCELYFNALVHYWSNGTWVPISEEMVRPIQFENIKYNVLKYGTDEDFNKIFTNLLSINTSLMPQDIKVLEWFYLSNPVLNYPDTIPFKENLCLLASWGAENLPVKTPTDVLRIAVSLSGGDISLPKVPQKIVRESVWTTKHIENPLRNTFKFKKFNRKDRRYLLSLLERTNCDVREMSLKDQRWVRLGEILHPGEYRKQFPKAYRAFDTIRNENVKSWYGELQMKFEESFENGLKFLSQRPGEFSRRLDSLLRRYIISPTKIDLILKYFKDASINTSNKVLFELVKHFENRTKSNGVRNIMIKGSRKNTKLPELPPMSEELVNKVVDTIHETLKMKFAKLDGLGRCYVDEELKNIPLPSNMRTMDFTTKPLIRGQRVSFDNPDAKVVRPFVHWMDKNGHEDLDLSATFIGMGKTEVLSFSGLKVGKSVHSGDVRHIQGPCAEYVDIDIQNALDLGFRYVLIDVRNFNGRSLKSVESVFGIMEREKPEGNRIWLPETISRAQTLTSESTDTLVSVLDLETREYIMLDVDSSGFVTARGDINNTLETLKLYMAPPKFSVYDLIMLHVTSRGVLTDNNEDVDTHFKYEDFINSYEETGKLMGV